MKPVPNIDENRAQHMVTFSVAFGVNGTLTDDPPNREDAFPWPDPLEQEDEERIDDMRHAAYNARGDFLNAKKPAELISSLSSAVSEIESRVGSASSVSFNSSELTEDTVIYRASFNSSRWSGELKSLQLDPISGHIASIPNWNASKELDAQYTRTILTYDGKDGIPFTWAALNNITAPVTAALNDLRSNNSGGTVSDAEAEARLDYLRGDRSNENGDGYAFRTRISRLGDIVHSSPVYVGKPAMDWPDTAPFPTTKGETYFDYKNGLAASRQSIVYVGSNDGMLHGFNAATGEEKIAYIPSILFSDNIDEGLHYISEDSYQHRYYVDLDPVLSDVYIRTSSTGGEAWRTILVGGLRAGGRGLYALDVTNPGNFSELQTNAENIVLWEFSNSDDADLGYTFSRPVITMMNNGEWAAIFGNGYNDTGDGEAKLFILFLEDGLDGWSTGDYIEITTESGNTTERNGLSSPAVADLDGDGDADRVYAGDLNGNLWAFDISSSSTNSWAVAYKQGSTPTPLFTANTNQPITAKPVLSLHPTMPDTTSNEPNIMIYFGTGQYMTGADNTNTDTQTLYGVWDNGKKVLSRSDLQEQEIDEGYISGTVITDNTVDYNDQNGWYFDLPISGERLITTPILWAGNIYFNSLVPVPVASPCSSGARGVLTVLDMVNGGRTTAPAMDVNGDGSVDIYDNVNAEASMVSDTDKDGDADSDGEEVGRQDNYGTGTSDIKQLGNNLYSGDPDEDKPLKIPADENDRTGRLSWQELL